MIIIVIIAIVIKISFVNTITNKEFIYFKKNLCIYQEFND